MTSDALKDTSELAKNLRILVVEDDALIAMGMEDVLTELGCAVVRAPRVKVGLTLIASQKIDGAFLDLDVGGLPVDPIAAYLASHQIPFAFVTGSAKSHVPAAFHEHPVLSKPFSEPRLREMVSAFRAHALRL